MFSRKSVFMPLLVGVALTACGREEEPREENAAPELTTQEQALQCRISSQSLVDVPGIQRLMTCGAQAGWSLHAGDVLWRQRNRLAQLQPEPLREVPRSSQWG